MNPNTWLKGTEVGLKASGAWCEAHESQQDAPHDSLKSTLVHSFMIYYENSVEPRHSKF